MLRDLGQAARSLAKAPGFTITAVVTIGLGMGAATAIFSVVNAVLLKGLPYLHADRLVLAWLDLTQRDVKDNPFSPGDFADLRAGASLFEEMAAVWTTSAVIATEGAAAEQVTVAGVTPNFLRMLGGRVVMGRDFRDEDGIRAPAAAGPVTRQPTMAILSHRLWQRLYGSDARMVGRSIELGGARVEIVGVLSPGFELLFPPRMEPAIERYPDIWLAARLDYANASRLNVFLRVIGRLRPGARIKQAQAQVDGVAADLRRRFALAETGGMRVRLEPMHEDVVSEVRPAILALMGSAVFLLLVACANVANLLLVRGVARQRDMAVRAALGASRWQMLGATLAESILLAVAGVAAGLAVARVGMAVFLSLKPEKLPGIETAAIDARVMGFAALAGVSTSVLFGLLPLLPRTSRLGLMEMLRSGGRAAGLARSGWASGAVVIGEVALSFLLLIGSGLMLQSFLALQRIDPGFLPEGLLTFRLSGNRAQQGPAFAEELRERLRALPGVQSVAAGTSLPLLGPHWTRHWGTEEAQADPHKLRQMTVVGVRPGYLETLGARLMAGRTFTSADMASGVKLGVVDQRLASRAFPKQSAIGRRIMTRMAGEQEEWFEVIGVVDPLRMVALAADPLEQMFVPDALIGEGWTVRWAIRAAGEPSALGPAVRDQVARMGGRTAVSEIESMVSVMDRARARTRLALVLLGAFAAIAAVLSTVGLYGVLSTSVRQRTAEIGLRMAMGASPLRVFRQVVQQGMWLSVTGIALGAIGAVALMRLLTSMLVGVGPVDPLTFAVMPGVFLLISAVGCWIPARRASRLDPMVALREE